MGNIDIRHDGKVLRILERRLRQRELQAATYGISADPSITIEIEDLIQEIRALKWKIDRLSEDRFRARAQYATGLSEVIIGLENNSSEVKYDLTGQWRLQEIYDYGRTTGDVNIRQDGNHLSGTMTIEDKMDDGETLIIQEEFSGTVRETTAFLYGERVYGVGRFVDDYEPDQWIGLIKDSNTIEGNSEDIEGTQGKFFMKRK